MKKITYRIVVAFFVLGLAAEALAEAKREYPRVSLVGGSGKGEPAPRDEFVLLVVEGPFMTFEKTPIPHDGVVAYVNDLMKAKSAHRLGVYIREGVKYGDVVKAVDLLRQTEAKDIGVSMLELAAGREP